MMLLKIYWRFYSRIVYNNESYYILLNVESGVENAFLIWNVGDLLSISIVYKYNYRCMNNEKSESCR